MKTRRRPLPAPTVGALSPVAHPARGADATREKLLQATHELLYESGGSEPSVSQICERAGVQVAMVSYCFGGKTQLLEALVARIIDGVIAEHDRFAALALEPEERLRRHVAAMIANFQGFPYVGTLGERLRGQRTVPEYVAATFAQPLIAFYDDLFSARDTFRPVDPTLFFFSVVGMCQYLFAARGMLDGSGETLDQALVERFTEHTVALLMAGIRA